MKTLALIVLSVTVLNGFVAGENPQEPVAIHSASGSAGITFQ